MCQAFSLVHSILSKGMAAFIGTYPISHGSLCRCSFFSGHCHVLRTRLPRSRRAPQSLPSGNAWETESSSNSYLDYSKTISVSLHWNHRAVMSSDPPVKAGHD
uniref:Putative secreted protein n=1 Tax=Amblyomma americanum TaxID=6943 RepID=A0A0C9RVU8_AMBAM